MAQTDPTELLPLTPLWFNILLAMGNAPLHGYAIIKEIEARTEGAMSPGTGTVYLALQRLLEDGLIVESGNESDVPTPGRPRRSYELTPLGRQVTALEARRIAQQLGVALEKKLVDSSLIRLP